MNLKKLRTNAGLTQKQLAMKMNTVQQTVARWEGGETALNADHIKQLCGILHCTAEELLGWSLSDVEQNSDWRDLVDVGSYFGTLSISMRFGTLSFPVGDVGKDDVDSFLERRSIVNRVKDRSEWMVVSAMNKRLLFVNFASVRSIKMESDEIETEDGHFDAEPQLVDVEANAVACDEVCVTFVDGSAQRFRLTQGVADDISNVLIAGEILDGSVLLIEDQHGGQLQTFINLSEVALIDVPTDLFVALTSDEED